MFDKQTLQILACYLRIFKNLRKITFPSFFETSNRSCGFRECIDIINNVGLMEKKFKYIVTYVRNNKYIRKLRLRREIISEILEYL